MNLFFHSLVGASTSLVCHKKIRSNDDNKIKYLSFFFTGNILFHGAMDIIPHNYPFELKTDIILTLILSSICLVLIILTINNYRTSLLVCYIGAVLPDVIDKMLLRYLGISNNIFPWHWSPVINFFYKYYRCTALFEITNFLVLFLCGLIIATNYKYIKYREFKARNKKKNNNI